METNMLLSLISSFIYQNNSPLPQINPVELYENLIQLNIFNISFAIDIDPQRDLKELKKKGITVTDYIRIEQEVKNNNTLEKQTKLILKMSEISKNNPKIADKIRDNPSIDRFVKCSILF